tara:strand:+ start:2403 stop:3500 length:1098 start_codon:yes stop_codon:yes gene_type:complete
MELKVRAVEGVEEKSSQQIEQELLDKAEQKHNNEEVEDTNVESTEAQVEEENTQSSELKEEDVLSFIKNRYEKEFTSVDQLFDQKENNEELPEDVKAYFEYKKSTGRGMEDYVRLNRDFSSMEDDQLLSEYLISSGEAQDLEDVDVLMDDYRFDEQLDEEKDIKKIKLAKKKAIAKAKKFFKEQKEMYKQPLESSTVGISEEQQKELDNYKQYLATAKSNQEEVKRKRDWFVDKTNEVFSDFKGFDFKIGDATLTFNPGDATKLKEAQLDSMSFVKKFMDKETGLLNDASGYHRALAIAMNPERFASFFYEQGKADATENVTRSMKNVDMTERKVSQVANRKDGLQIRSISQPSSRGLTIKSKKK